MLVLVLQVGTDRKIKLNLGFAASPLRERDLGEGQDNGPR